MNFIRICFVVIGNFERVVFVFLFFDEIFRVGRGKNCRCSGVDKFFVLFVFLYLELFM